MNGNTTKRVVVDAGHGGIVLAQKIRMTLIDDVMEKVLKKVSF